MDNPEWLKSLSDRALADEIRYGRILSDGNSHRSFNRRELLQAIDEKRRREEERSE